MWRQGDDTLFSKLAIVLKLRYHCAIYFAILFLFPAWGDIRKYWSYLHIMRNNVYGEVLLFICKIDAGRDWGLEEKGTTEDEMAGWHHRLDGYESEWTLWVGDGQGGLARCDSWGRKESDTTEWLNWTELMCMRVCVHMCDDQEFWNHMA